MNEDITAYKKTLRTAAQLTRDSIPQEVRIAKSQTIAKRIIDIIDQTLVSQISAMPTSAFETSNDSHTINPTLLTYLPFRSEVDVMPIVRWCWKRHIHVAAPKVDTATKRMLFYYIKEEGEIAPGAWNIPEPTKTQAPLNNSVSVGWMLIPGLAFDLNRGRLGYGGGYYDRFFAEWLLTNLPLPTRIAAAFDEQLVPEVPTAPHDIRMSMVVTDKRVVS